MNRLRYPLLLLVIAAVVLSFMNFYNRYIGQFRETAAAKENILSTRIDLACRIIDDLELLGESLLEADLEYVDPLFDKLVYNINKGIYHLDVIEGTSDQEISGNLTGVGPIPTKKESIAEINAALMFNKFFDDYYEEHSTISRIRYISSREFVNTFPWISSSEYSYSKSVKSEDSYHLASPSHNPYKARVWSSIKTLENGEHMIVLSKPVYDIERFVGVISIDLKSTALEDMLSGGSTTYVYTDFGEIYVCNIELTNRSSNPADNTLSKRLNLSEDDTLRIKYFSDGNVHLYKNMYIYKYASPNAPWNLLTVVSIWEIIGKSALATIPILLVSILLILLNQMINKSKDSEKNMERERNMLLTTMRSIGEGLIMTDSDSRVQLVNYAAEKYLNQKASQIRGMLFDDVFNCVDMVSGKIQTGLVDSVLQSGENYTFKKYFVLKSGEDTQINISGTIAVIKSSSGKITGAVVSFTDITKEFQQENEISGFLEINLDMMCVIDRKGFILNANNKFEDITGYRPFEIVGMQYYKYLHKDDLKKAFIYYEQVRKGERYKDCIIRIKCKDGMYRYIAWFAKYTFEKYYFVSGRDVTASVIAEKETYKAAHEDNLTGANNRNYLNMILDGRVPNINFDVDPMSMTVFDLDDFKTINDSQGHPVGDEMLKLVVDTIMSEKRRTDVLVRMGGDEFSVFMPHTPLEDAMKAAEKFRIAIAGINRPYIGIRTSSFGVAQRLPGEHFDVWYHRADKALYDAKRNGKNCVAAAE